jgi:hypothetical protein
MNDRGPEADERGDELYRTEQIPQYFSQFSFLAALTAYLKMDERIPVRQGRIEELIEVSGHSAHRRTRRSAHQNAWFMIYHVSPQ